MTSIKHEDRGTALAPIHYQGPTVDRDDLHLNRQYFSYEADGNVVAGSLLSIIFTVDAPVRDVWPTFKDFNLWQNVYEHYYSGVVGDLEGKTFRLKLTQDAPGYEYNVIRVIPEHTIVVSQPLPDEGATHFQLPGAGGVSPGFHVFLLNERAGQTVISVLMQHAAVMGRAGETAGEEAIAHWQKMGAEGIMKWRDIFIPTLRKLVADA